jgi:hypothetical protein
MGAKIMLCDPHRAVVMGHDFQSQLSDHYVFTRQGGIFTNCFRQLKEQVPYKTLSKLIVDMKELTSDSRAIVLPLFVL